jgi:hypothetical protein
VPWTIREIEHLLTKPSPNDPQFLQESLGNTMYRLYLHQSFRVRMGLQSHAMRRLAIVLMALGVPIAPQIGRAQSSLLSAARVHASVEADAHGAFVYRYSVENGAPSTAGISKVAIDISLAAGASKPSATGLTNGPGFFAESPTAGRKPVGSIPVGLSAPQPGWRTTAGTDATARWVAVQDKNLVLPKQRLAGFTLTSHGPPTFRRFTLVPHVDPDRAPVMEAGCDPGEQDRFKQELEQYVESQTVEGTTLGPGAPVKQTADAMLADLTGQVGQARSLRWVSSDAAARNITDKLQAARAAISRGQVESGANTLRALRTEVEAQSGKGLTSEAVALVGLNIQYILRIALKL